MIEWLRTKVAGRSYSEIAQSISGAIDIPLVIVWLLDMTWEHFAAADAKEMCLVQVMKNTELIETAEKTCERWLGMQDFGIPDPIILATWGFWVLLVAVYYHNRNKPYPWGPR
jgi:hypothetical protein